jgi:hypothetical protein
VHADADLAVADFVLLAGCRSHTRDQPAKTQSASRDG